MPKITHEYRVYASGQRFDDTALMYFDFYLDQLLVVDNMDETGDSTQYFDQAVKVFRALENELNELDKDLFTGKIKVWIDQITVLDSEGYDIEKYFEKDGVTTAVIMSKDVDFSNL